MTRAWISIRSAARWVALWLTPAWLVLTSTVASGNLPDPRPILTESLEALAAAVADSMEARCSAGSVRVIEEHGWDVRIDRGSSGGLRPFTRVTLYDSQSPAWEAEVISLTEQATWLKPVTPGLPGPAVGTIARIRLGVGRLALAQPDLDDVAPADRGLVLAWHDRVAFHVAARSGLHIVRLPDYPDSSEYREVAAATGADLSVRTLIRVDSSGWNIQIRMAGVRRTNSLEMIVGHAPPQRLEAINTPRVRGLASGEPPPGLRTGVTTTTLDGPILDIISRRWQWSDVQVILDDRIEAWRTTPDGLQPDAVVDLSTIWPIHVPTRWPVAEMIAVNTFYDMTGEEARVNYSLCSNQRPRYLTINIGKDHPESLNMVVSDGPLDILPASVGGCFQELDRVAIPAGFDIDRTMPKTAVARLALEEILRDGSGRVLRSQNGQLRRQKVAVIHHDEATASLWLSSPDRAMRLPGSFGVEMDEYRAGLAGPPGFLVTSASIPGEPDHLEWWVLTETGCERRWVGPALDGSITSILVGDRDGDERDDMVLGEVRAVEEGYRSRLRLYSSRPRGGVTP